jgi:hypothetical protein
MTLPVDQLGELDVDNVIRRLKRILLAANLSWCIGALDFSLNEEASGGRDPYWSVHLHALSTVRSPSETSAKLRSAAPSSEALPRPVNVRALDGGPDAINYVFKSHFMRRISDVGTRVNAKTDKKRLCRITKTARLRASENHELLLLLDRIGPRGPLLQLKALVRSGKVVLLAYDIPHLVWSAT